MEALRRTGREYHGAVFEVAQAQHVRFALQDGHPCGVTVLGFRAAKWDRNVNRLSSIVSRHLRVEPQSVTRVLSGLDG